MKKKKKRKSAQTLRTFKDMRYHRVFYWWSSCCKAKEQTISQNVASTLFVCVCFPIISATDHCQSLVLCPSVSFTQHVPWWKMQAIMFRARGFDKSSWRCRTTHFGSGSTCNLIRCQVGHTSTIITSRRTNNNNNKVHVFHLCFHEKKYIKQIFIFN